MKVFFVNSTKAWGGGEKWHLETACAMGNKGHEVAVLAQVGKELYRRSIKSGLRTIPVAISNLSFANPFSMVRLYRVLRHERPDFVILNLSADIKSAGLCAKWAGIRNIIYRRGSAIPIRNTFINRILYRRVVTYIIANSEETKRTILQNNPRLFPSDRIEVIYNGIDLNFEYPVPDALIFQRKKQEILIGNAGRLVEQKGQKYLIEIARILQSMDIDFRVLVAGEGPLLSPLKQMAASAGVKNHFVFLGFVDSIRNFMRTIDIFVLPSLWEGFGYVLVEAMACAKPVIAFDLSSNPEIIEHGKTGYLVNRDNISGLAQKTADLCRDPVLRQRMGIAGRERAEKLFGVEQSHSKVEELLMRLTRNGLTYQSL